MKIEGINELDVKLLEKHDEKIIKHILNRLDNLINIINDEEFLLLYLNPKGNCGNDKNIEKLLYYRLRCQESKIKSMIYDDKDFKYNLLHKETYEKFEKKIKEAYLRRLEKFE